MNRFRKWIKDERRIGGKLSRSYWLPKSFPRRTALFLITWLLFRYSATPHYYRGVLLFLDWSWYYYHSPGSANSD